MPMVELKPSSRARFEMVSASLGLPSNGHHAAAESAGPATQRPPKKKPAKRSGSGDLNGGRTLPEVGSDELVGRQHPGAALTASAPGTEHAAAEAGAEKLTAE